MNFSSTQKLLGKQTVTKKRKKQTKYKPKISIYGREEKKKGGFQSLKQVLSSL